MRACSGECCGLVKECDGERSVGWPRRKEQSKAKERAKTELEKVCWLMWLEESELGLSFVGESS